MIGHLKNISMITTKRRKAVRLTDEQKELVRRYLFGPFKKEWYDEDGVLDNSDRRIAEDLGVPLRCISPLTSKLTEKHFKENVNNK